MVAKQDRRLRKKTVKSMLTWSHYSFKQFLFHKARETKTDIIIVDKSYTSRTRGCCGHLSRSSGDK